MERIFDKTVKFHRPLIGREQQIEMRVAMSPARSLESWALSVFFFIFSIVKKFFFIFYKVNRHFRCIFLLERSEGQFYTISAPVLFKKPTHSQINLIKNAKNHFLLVKK